MAPETNGKLLTESSAVSRLPSRAGDRHTRDARGRSAGRGGAVRIAVLGAGIVGVTAAHALAERGHEVHVYDRRSVVASDTSASTAGSSLRATRTHGHHRKRL